MAELFRYIEQSFVIPSATPAIDVGNDSDLQKGLRGDIAKHPPADRIRGKASGFILKHFSSPVADPFQLGKQYLAFGDQLLGLSSPGTPAVDKLIADVFGSDARKVVASSPFLSDKALLDDTLVCVKITTAFDRVNAHELVAARQAISFLEDFAAGKVKDFSHEHLKKTLRRPIRIPTEFIQALNAKQQQPQPESKPNPELEIAVRRRKELEAAQQHFKTAYTSIMSLEPRHYEIKPVRPGSQHAALPAKKPHASGNELAGNEGRGTFSEATANPIFFALPHSLLERLGPDVRKTLEKAGVDVTGAPASEVITAIKREWQSVSKELAPYQIPAPAKVFRVGAHLFAVQDSPPVTAPNIFTQPPSSPNP